MITSLVSQLGLAVVLVVLAGFAAAVEVALARVSRGRAAELVTQGRRGAEALQKVILEPAPAINVTIFVRVLAEAGAAVTVTLALLDSVGWRWPSALLAAFVMAFISFIAVGVGPRTLGRQYAEQVGLAAAPVVIWLERILGPLTRLLVMIGNVLTPGKGMREGPFSSEAELRRFVDIAQESALIEAGERKMIHSVIDFGDTVAREVMVPRTDMVALERGTRLHEAMTLLLRSGYSRMPVVGDGLDDLQGLLYLKDVAARLHENPETAGLIPVEHVMRQAVFVPDSKPVDDLLRDMQLTTGHAAVVVDEYGGTAGLVTLEDIIEEIVGDISDEYDRDAPEIEALADGVYRVSARLHRDELGELFGVEVEDEEVDTVGGLLSKALGRVPIAGSQADVAGLSLTAERVEGRRHQLATVLVHRLEVAPHESNRDQREREHRERDEDRERERA